MKIRCPLLKPVVVACLATALTIGRLPSAGAAESAPPSTESENKDLSDEKIISPMPAVALLASGGVMLLAGVVTGAFALKMNHDLKNDCPGGFCYEPYHEDADRLDALAAVTDALIPVGIGLLVSGGFVLVLHKKTKRRYGADYRARGRNELQNRFIVTGRSIGWRF